MATTAGRRAIRPRTITTTTTASSLSSTRSLSTSSLLSSSSTSTSTANQGRYFSDAAPAAKIAGDAADLSSPKLQGLYDRCVTLPEEDVNVLGAMVLQLLGRTIFPGEFGTPGGGNGMMAAGAGAEAEVVEEEVKTHFDVKLLGFNAKSKIKVIKEVRAVAGLGLKEAKTLVESAPKIIQKGLKQDAADALKEKLEALGAEIEII